MTHIMLRYKKLLLLTGLCVLLSMGFSCAFLSSHALHDCTGADCEICRQLGDAGSLSGKTDLHASACTALLFLFLPAALLCRRFPPSATATLIALKVRLNS